MTKHHVSDTEQDAVLDYAISVLSTLRMPQWTILLMEDPSDEDTAAQIRPIDGRHVAQLYLARDWDEMKSETRREVVTHEMLHLVHRNVSTVVLDDTANLMHDHEHDDWSRRVRREFELMVDHLAAFMASTHQLGDAWDTAHRRARKRARARD